MVAPPTDQASRSPRSLPGSGLAASKGMGDPGVGPKTGMSQSRASAPLGVGGDWVQEATTTPLLHQRFGSQEPAMAIWWTTLPSLSTRARPDDVPMTIWVPSGLDRKPF
jgi:hypothetical protein